MKNDPEIQLSPVQVNKDNVTIILSKEIAKYLKISRKTREIFLIPTNSVVQMSVGKPITVIPALTQFNMEFEEQEDLG